MSPARELRGHGDRLDIVTYAVSLHGLSDLPYRWRTQAKQRLPLKHTQFPGRVHVFVAQIPGKIAMHTSSCRDIH